MPNKIITLTCLSMVMAALSPAIRPAAASGIPKNVLYVQSNITAAGKNSVFGYARAADGTLSPLPGSPFATGGTGFYDPTYQLGPFDSDQNLVADPRTGVLYTPNSGSNTIAALAIRPNGKLLPLPRSPFPAFGSNPLSVGVNGDRLIVVNGDENPANPKPHAHPSFRGAPIVDGAIARVPGGKFPLATGSAPGQALTTNTHGFVFTQEFLGGTIRSFYQAPLGQLVELDHVMPPIESGDSGQPLPLGLWAHPYRPLLYVGLTNVSRLAVYRWSERGKLTFVRSVADTGAAPCWVRVNAAGTRLYAVNTASRSIAVYDLTDPENPKQIQDAAVAPATGGLFQFSLSPDEKFIYVLEQESTAASVGKANKIHVLAINPADGTLKENVAAITTLPVPSLTRAVGMLVF